MTPLVLNCAKVTLDGILILFINSQFFNDCVWLSLRSNNDCCNSIPLNDLLMRVYRRILNSSGWRKCEKGEHEVSHNMRSQHEVTTKLLRRV